MSKKKKDPHILWLIKSMHMAYDEGKGLWAHSLLDAIKGLSAEQAAWKPRKKDARSVWEIVNHVAFWKDAMARSLEKKPWLDASKHKGWP
ncbi:hypothetical protein HY230_06120 [Candidatus Acetothermia bacterium]|nr:hypothetical protein [Candidatus Acetothermia bacterium]